MLLDEDRLGVAEGLETAHAPLTANSALLVSTEWCERGNLKMSVHPNTAGLQLAGDASALFEILGPH